MQTLSFGSTLIISQNMMLYLSYIYKRWIRYFTHILEFISTFDKQIYTGQSIFSLPLGDIIFTINYFKCIHYCS